MADNKYVTPGDLQSILNTLCEKLRIGLTF